MTPIPARLIRPQAEACLSRPIPTEHDRNRRTYILEAAERAFIEHGNARLTLREFAAGIAVSQHSVRRHICDMHHLFGLVLARHLDRIIAALGRVPRDAPDLFAARREAYFRATRGLCDVPTPIHFLLVQDRRSLPEDEFAAIERQRRLIAGLIAAGGTAAGTAAADSAEQILNLLDTPTMRLPKVEYLVAAIEAFDRSCQDAAPNPPPAREPLRPQHGQPPAPKVAAPNFAAPSVAPPSLAAPNVAAPGVAAPGAQPTRHRVLDAPPFPVAGLVEALAALPDAALTPHRHRTPLHAAATQDDSLIFQLQPGRTPDRPPAWPGHHEPAPVPAPGPTGGGVPPGKPRPATRK